MLTPSKKLYYAVEAVLYIAYNANHHPISSREIARQQGLPPRYLEQIMQRLVHGHILRGTRGPRGGYMLAKDKKHIHLHDICELVNEDDIVSELPPTTELGNHVVRPLWEEMLNDAQAKLANVTIADLCHIATEKSIGRYASQKVDSTE
ncbi:MAG: RrF2 family transcriptional regulator [Rickettsiales bacterium]